MSGLVLSRPLPVVSRSILASVRDHGVLSLFFANLRKVYIPRRPMRSEGRSQNQLHEHTRGIAHEQDGMTTSGQIDIHGP